MRVYKVWGRTGNESLSLNPDQINFFQDGSGSGWYCQETGRAPSPTRFSRVLSKDLHAGEEKSDLKLSGFR